MVNFWVITVVNFWIDEHRCLHSEQRLSDAGPLEPIHFVDTKRDVVAQYLASDEARPYLPALDRLADSFVAGQARLC